MYSYADEPPEVNCIVGEASGEGIAGMVAVAQAIHNRGNIKRVYGCHAEHIKSESQDTIDLARWVWISTIHPDQSGMIYLDEVNGANSWGTKSDIRKNHMDRKCKETAVIGRHIFFKC